MYWPLGSSNRVSQWEKAEFLWADSVSDCSNIWTFEEECEEDLIWDNFADTCHDNWKGEMLNEGDWVVWKRVSFWPILWVPGVGKRSCRKHCSNLLRWHYVPPFPTQLQEYLPRLLMVSAKETFTPWPNSIALATIWIIISSGSCKGNASNKWTTGLEL